MCFCKARKLPMAKFIPQRTAGTRAGAGSSGSHPVTLSLSRQSAHPTSYLTDCQCTPCSKQKGSSV